MAETTNIEWADATWNPWHGCAKVSTGCKFCYMYREKKQYGQNPELVVRSKTKFDEPLKWQRKWKRAIKALLEADKHLNHGGQHYGAQGILIDCAAKIAMDPQPRFIFTCSWSDWFIEEADEWRPEAWKIIRSTPEFTYLILTKRPERIHAALPADWGRGGYPNVWLGVSAENQKYAALRIPHLLRTSCARKFLSLEPLLDSIDLRNLNIADAIDGQVQLDALTGHIYSNGKWTGFFNSGGVDWVIVGGESGSAARPMEPAWVRSLRNQIVPPKTMKVGDADVMIHHGSRPQFFFKQWGEWAPPEVVAAKDITFAIYDRARNLYKVGTEKAGNVLDGRTWLERPLPLTAKNTKAHEVASA